MEDAERGRGVEAGTGMLRAITHLVLDRGHRWGLRDVTIPIGAVAKVETDDVTLSLTRDQLGALPEMAVPRWPAFERARTTTTPSPRRRTRPL